MKYLTGEKEKEAITWLNYAAEIARDNATCHRAKCGAVIVKEYKVLGIGYNSPPLDKEENRRCDQEITGRYKYDKTCCLHAEWRAILNALCLNKEKIVDSIMYFVRLDNDGNIKNSGKPYCTVCSRLVLDLGIKNFVMKHEEGMAEYTAKEFNDLSHEYKE